MPTANTLFGCRYLKSCLSELPKLPYISKLFMIVPVTPGLRAWHSRRVRRGRFFMFKKNQGLGPLMKLMHLSFNTDVLDEFRDHFYRSISAQEQTLRESYGGVSASDFEHEQDFEGFASSLEDDYHQAQEVKSLGEELSIVGLHRLVEIQISKVLRGTFPGLSPAKKQDLVAGKSGVIDCPSLAGYDAANELRMINNCVKHNSSVIDNKLATAFPAWIECEPLEDLGTHYSRLKPRVIEYITAFVNEAHAKTTVFTSAPVTASPSSV